MLVSCVAQSGPVNAAVQVQLCPELVLRQMPLFLQVFTSHSVPEEVSQRIPVYPLAQKHRIVTPSLEKHVPPFWHIPCRQTLVDAMQNSANVYSIFLLGEKEIQISEWGVVAIIYLPDSLSPRFLSHSQSLFVAIEKSA